MVEIGTRIRAQVTGVEHYAIRLLYNNERVIVLIPEISWTPTTDIRTVAKSGDYFDVLVIRYNYGDREIVGSIKRLNPDKNPYRGFSRLEPGTVLHGTVRRVTPEHVTVKLSDHVEGRIPRHKVKREIAEGESVNVTIAALEVDDCNLVLDLA